MPPPFRARASRCARPASPKRRARRRAHWRLRRLPRYAGHRSPQWNPALRARFHGGSLVLGRLTALAIRSSENYRCSLRASLRAACLVAPLGRDVRTSRDANLEH